MFLKSLQIRPIYYKMKRSFESETIHKMAITNLQQVNGWKSSVIFNAADSINAGSTQRSKEMFNNVIHCHIDQCAGWWTCRQVIISSGTITANPDTWQFAQLAHGGLNNNYLYWLCLHNKVLYFLGSMMSWVRPMLPSSVLVCIISHSTELFKISYPDSTPAPSAVLTHVNPY